MKPGTIFLRAGCRLPDGLGLKQEQLGDSWMSADNMASTALDAAVRGAGWHFMWLAAPCSRRGFGRTEESATKHAIIHALSRIRARFNAAELESIQIARYPRFWIAKATVSTRHVQQAASLSIVDEMSIRQLSPQ